MGDREKAIFLILGTMATRNKKRATAIARLSEHEVDSVAIEGQPGVNRVTALFNRASLFRKLRGFPGMVVEYETSNDFTTLHGSGAYLGMWEDSNLVAQLQAADKAQRATLDAEAIFQKDKRRDVVLEQLEPIREIYKELPAPQKRQLIALVVERLTR